MNKKIVVFDVGRTLVKITHKDIIRFFLKRGKTNIFFLYIIYFLFFIHKIIGINNKNVCHITKFSYKIFKNQDAKEMNKISEDFFDSYLKDKIYNKSVETIKQHVENGYEVVLISALFPGVVDCLKKYLNLNFVIVPELEVVDGKYTGKVLNLIPYGSNKAILVRKLVEKENFSFSNSYAYSDRFSDIELFELVDVPIVVNPEPKLRIEANKRNWKILDLSI
ncbi:MAG: HAD family phosphatase [Patescibacteria group bacterium]|nr:HAD family phosphatase [Patescibacteria group bacterium]MDD4304588.1 HAD family phosphatase [Patescibacteria group bacterium]MDD4695623.1 HAD family phosphatase [Patescibacteria group bacterium]